MSMDGHQPHELSDRLRAARERAGLSQEQLAHQLGMSTKGYRAYETHRQPDQRRLEQIAAALNITIAELLVDDGLGAVRRQLAVVRNELRLVSTRVAELEERMSTAPRRTTRKTF